LFAIVADAFASRRKREAGVGLARLDHLDGDGRARDDVPCAIDRAVSALTDEGVELVTIGDRPHESPRIEVGHAAGV
jgi:hypothetical protein